MSMPLRIAVACSRITSSADSTVSPSNDSRMLMMLPCDIGQTNAASDTNGEQSLSPQPSIPLSIRTRTTIVSCVPSAAAVISGIFR